MSIYNSPDKPPQPPRKPIQPKRRRLARPPFPLWSIVLGTAALIASILLFAKGLPKWRQDVHQATKLAKAVRETVRENISPDGPQSEKARDIALKTLMTMKNADSRRVLRQSWRYDGPSPSTLDGQPAELWTLTVDVEVPERVTVSHQFTISGDTVDAGASALVDFAEGLAEERAELNREFDEQQRRLRQQYNRETPTPQP